MPNHTNLQVVPPAGRRPADDRLDSWKEIAAYLKRGARTVQRWEREEGLPVHRLRHDTLGSVYAYRSELDAWWSGRGAELREPAPDAFGPPAIAVLPFVDMSQERDQAYFCDGMAEEIINALSRLKGLRVVSRTASFRFRSAGGDTREVGRRLHAGTLLEGSVRKSAERLRIAVQVSRAGTGYQLWSAQYDRELKDIFVIQDEIARNVAHALQVTLTPNEADALRRPFTRDLGAYDCYLRGRSFYYRYSPQAIEFALKLFLQAMQIDPNYAQAYAGLADCWSYLYFYSSPAEILREQADWASSKAVEMDPGLAQAQASRGFSLSLQGRNEEAAIAFETAIRLDSGLFEAYYFYARHCFALGEREKALTLYEQAIRTNPLDFQSRLLMAQIYDDVGRPANAVSARRRGIELASQHLKMNPDDARALYMAANGLAALGEPERAHRAAGQALALQPEDPVLLYNVGCIFSMLGLVEPALDCMEKAAGNGLTQKGWYLHDSNLDALRGQPRFQQLLQSLP
ncbi:MAG: tetratricopeptide repeat protein [Candidatus Sulfopaludibacter sp.]|nr:tetratricopeptide repeat protein [Candidatus Sulfopaludibacter sp.]